MQLYGNCLKFSDGKLRMGPSESSCQSSRVPKKCGRASEVWSRARSALLTLGLQRAHRVAFGRSARSKNRSFNNKKNGAYLRQGFRWYERAGERPERTQAVGLKEWWAGLHSAERASEFTAAGRRAGLFNELHPKFILAESMAVRNKSSGPSELGIGQPIVRH
jgi:hypothetical protein